MKRPMSVDEKLEKCIHAMKVIRTWAALDMQDGRMYALFPQDVVKLLDKTFNEIEYFVIED